MKKLYILLLTGLLALPVAGFAMTEGLNGIIETGIQGVDLDNQSGRFDEFKTVDDGLNGRLNMNAFKDGRYLNLDAIYSGYDDESFELKGGKFGTYKYSLFYDEMVHNYSYGNRTIYSGIGTDDLSYFAVDNVGVPAVYTPNVTTDSSLWTTFDYGIDRQNYGAKMEFNFNTPFYVIAELSREETTGVKPLGVASGVYGAFSAGNFSAFGQVVELPEPVDYENDILTLKSGYSTKKFLLELAGTISSFENSNDTLAWRNPYVTSQELDEVSVLAPDSDYYKLSAKGVIRDLPINSTLALKTSLSKMENDITLLDEIWAGNNGPTFGGGLPIYTLTTLGLNRSTFEGDVQYTKVSLALSSRPSKKLRTKVYYNYLDKSNDSSHIVYTGPTTATVENHLFEYEKHNLGVDLGYKLTKNNKLSGGYELKTIDRERDDFDSTTDNKLYVQLKNTSLDMATFNVKLQYLDRSADFRQANDPVVINRFVRRYDAADKKQTVMKVGAEIYPTENLDLGIEYSYKVNDYDETILGLSEDVRHEFYVDAAYQFPDSIRFSGYAGYELVSLDSDHRQFTTGNPDPTVGNDGDAFNWSQELKSDYLVFGLMAEVPLIKNKLDFMLAYNFQDNDGSNDFTTEGATAPEDIENVDDYTKHQVEAKCQYSFSDNLKMAVGYLYEKLDYADDQYDDYIYYNSGAFNSYYLSGVYADNDYEANIGYMTLSYRF